MTYALPLPFAPAEADPFTEFSARVSDLNQAPQSGSLFMRDWLLETMTCESMTGRWALSLRSSLGRESPGRAGYPNGGAVPIVGSGHGTKNDIEAMRFKMAVDAREPEELETIKKLEAALARAVSANARMPAGSPPLFDVPAARETETKK